eukprot:GFUD01032082.1.p1 GENE.GFUD01032082.1~~GFUD01032082.1.p1  ORF type:complete len:141 (-),score=19.77 GFUD01032082.1:128-550(-)
MEYRYFTEFTFFCIFVAASMARSIPDSKTGTLCSGASYCENPQDYPGTLILNLLKNQTFPHGLFDEKPSGNRSVDFMNMITKNVFNFVSKEDSDAYELSNHIDDQLVNNTLEDSTNVTELRVNYNQDEDEQTFNNEKVKV